MLRHRETGTGHDVLHHAVSLFRCFGTSNVWDLEEDGSSFSDGDALKLFVICKPVSVVIYICRKASDE